jgi:hypothetical protein
MMSVGVSWWSELLATDAPALPTPWVMQLGLGLGWALVLALLGAGLTCRMKLSVRRFIALALALWTLVPGPVSPGYWLGLAFHMPSLTAMLLCAWGLQRLLFARGDGCAGVPSSLVQAPRPAWPWLTLPVLLGYALLLDTFAVLPISLPLYVWGFSPALLIGLVVLALLPWVVRGGLAAGGVAANWIVPSALLLFAATRLPTGNLWDALMDPWLWLLLHGLLIRRLLRSWRARG